jgi:Cys-rich four helix bundle protein (predicted Tat secretion target)
MDRRHFAAVAGTAAVFAAAREGVAQDGHAGHAGGHAAHAGGNYQELAKASAHCVMTGQNCLRHCLETFAAGDTTLAACAKSVRELIAATAALQDLAAASSTYVPAMRRVVETICVGCEQECRKHAQHHATCRACADACLDCAAACRKAAA